MSVSISNGRDERLEPGHDDGDASDTPPALAAGFVIGGKYQVKRVLGMGGNGAVYDCEHTEVGHRVAVKVAHRKLDDRGDVMTRFRREARTCGSLRHPHVGQVFDVGTLEDGAPYMVMELLEGRSLADVIDDTTLPIAAIVHITRQVLGGLAAAHQSGVIHLDIKPDNVMLVRDHGGDVVAKLVDFGISRRLNEPEPERAAADEGFIVGSPDYMPPEQLRGETVDTRTDVYATGVLLYEAITGRTPFDAATTVAELVDSIMRDPIPPPTGLRADCPAELERVVLKALSRDAEGRYASAEAMSRALAEVGVVTRATPQANLDAFNKQQPERTRRATTQRRKRTIDERMLQTLRIRKPSALDLLTLSGPTAFTPAGRRAQARRTRIAAGVAAAVLGLLAIGGLILRGGGSDEVVTATELSPAAPVPAPAPAPVAANVAVAAAAPAAPPVVSVVAAPVAPPPAPPVAVEAPAAPPVEAAPVEPEDTKAPDQPATSSRRRAAQRRARNRAAEPAPAAPKAASTPAPAPAVAPAPPPPPEQDPQLTRTQLLAAEAAFNSGQDAKALNLFRQLVKAAPRAAEAWRGLAASANRMAERSEAERALRRYLQLRPGARDAGQILQLKRL